jgi:hypothetical protein
MAQRRLPCEPAAPERGPGEVPNVSGEYRMVRRPAIEMPAVQGRMLQDEIAYDLDDGLDIPLLDAPRLEVPPPAPLNVAPPRTPSRTSSGTAIDPHAVFVAFAKFGPPPQTIWQSPAYAIRVMKRRRVLVRELADARRRGSKDVGLYEAALRTAESGAVRAGIAVMIAMVVLAAGLSVAVAQVVRGALRL